MAELTWDLTDEKYEKELQRIDGLKELAEKKVSEANPLTSLMDLILEGLHQHSKVGKTDLDDARQYNDMLGSMLGGRSEEHTSELQSRGHLVCRLLLEKKNTLTS